MKPMDLIVANLMHDHAPQLDHDLTKKVFNDDPKQKGLFATALARKLLCSISHEAGAPAIYKALAAIGAPSSETEIMQALEAARDAQQAESGEPKQAADAAAGAWPKERDVMINELATILGVERENLPTVFLTGRVQILKRGVRFDILQRFPLADTSAISDWLERYTNSKFYLERFLQGSRHRHDLDGNDTEKILGSDRAYAKERLNKCK